MLFVPGSSSENSPIVHQLWLTDNEVHGGHFSKLNFHYLVTEFDELRALKVQQV
jgi:hypothetical protein